MLYVVAFALGVGETLHDTAAQSIVPSLVAGAVPLERVNSRLYAVELTANQFVGPALGGLVAGVALTAGLSASALAYLVAALARGTIAGNFRPAAREVPTRLRSDIAEGIAYLARHQLLRALAVCVGVSNLASAAMFAVFPSTPSRRVRWDSVVPVSGSCSPRSPPVRSPDRSSSVRWCSASGNGEHCCCRWRPQRCSRWPRLVSRRAVLLPRRLVSRGGARRTGLRCAACDSGSVPSPCCSAWPCW
jgi:hypothetical protein